MPHRESVGTSVGTAAGASVGVGPVGGTDGLDDCDCVNEAMVASLWAMVAFI